VGGFCPAVPLNRHQPIDATTMRTTAEAVVVVVVDLHARRAVGVEWAAHHLVVAEFVIDQVCEQNLGFVVVIVIFSVGQVVVGLRAIRKAAGALVGRAGFRYPRNTDLELKRLGFGCAFCDALCARFCVAFTAAHLAGDRQPSGPVGQLKHDAKKLLFAAKIFRHLANDLVVNMQHDFVIGCLEPLHGCNEQIARDRLHCIFN
jgi:hypothetical protein